MRTVRDAEGSVQVTASPAFGPGLERVDRGLGKANPAAGEEVQGLAVERAQETGIRPRTPRQGRGRTQQRTGAS